MSPLASSPGRERFVALFILRLAVLLGVTFVACAARLIFVQGWIRPVRIYGDSMAPALLGEHYATRCNDCGWIVRAGLERVTADFRPTCPNCGHLERKFTASNRVRGQRVLIDRLKSGARHRRGDLVAIASPGVPNQLAVKRVVGLPGEQIELFEGDVWVDGRRHGKSLEEFREQAILVHDDLFRPKAELADRWQPLRFAAGEEENTNWTRTSGGFQFGACGNHSRTATHHAEGDWLAYQHWSCMPSGLPPRARAERTPVWDYYGINQALSRGSLHSVRDLGVSFVLEFDHLVQGWVGVRILDHEGYVLEARWEPRTGDLEMRWRGSRIGRRMRLAELRTGRQQVEFIRCDGQVLLAVNGRLLVRQKIEVPNVQRRQQVDNEVLPELDGLTHLNAPLWTPAKRPAAAAPTRNGIHIGALAGSRFRLQSIRVWRDVVYLDRYGGLGRVKLTPRLGKDEYCLLGDNPPASRDSRFWSPPQIRRKSMVGRVLHYRRRLP